MTTWSISPFFMELDVLEIRLATLDPLIDIHVLAEATVDQRGNPKPLHLATALQSARFAPWAHKIRVVTVDDMPTRQDGTTLPHWEREAHQQNALLRAMDDLGDWDPVLVADLDEIPYPAMLAEGLAEPPLRFPMDMHVYRLNWRWKERPVLYGSATGVFYGHVLRDLTVKQARSDAAGRWLDHSAGWHLAYMGDAERVAGKVRAISHNTYTELVPDAKKEGRTEESWTSAQWAQHCIDTGDDVFGRDDRKAEWVGVDQLPAYVGENQGRFEHLLIGRPA